MRAKKNPAWEGAGGTARAGPRDLRLNLFMQTWINICCFMVCMQFLSTGMHFGRLDSIRPGRKSADVWAVALNPSVLIGWEGEERSCRRGR